MPDEKIKTTEDSASDDLQTQSPIDERDEVKQAEERTRKLQEKVKSTDIHPDDKGSEA